MHLPSKLALVGAAAGYLLATVVAEPNLATSPIDELHLLTKRVRSYKNSTVVNKNYADKVLLKEPFRLAPPNVTSGEVSLDVNATVVCKTCYVKFTATAELVVQDSFNASSAIQSQAQSHADKVQNMTTQVVNDITASLANHTTDTLLADFPGLQMPTVDLDFALNLSSIPQCQVVYTFDELDAFVELQTDFTGKASFDLGLYDSEVPLNINVGDNLNLKVSVFVSLLIDVDGAINREIGFHIKLADGLAMTVNFNDNKVSSIDFKSGKFELFPPIIQDTSNATINARLRVTVMTSVDVSPGSTVKVLGVDLPYEAGVEFSLFTDIAGLTLSAATNTDNCAVLAQEAFQYAVGAVAGVKVDINGHIWKPPALSTLLPVWNTVTSQCAPTTLSDTSTAVARRADASGASDVSVTSTISTAVTYSAVGCRSAGLAGCPVSLQSTIVTTVESTSVTVVPFGSTATWPASTATTATPIAFGTNAKSISLSVSGTPSSFVPAATASGSGGSGNSSSSSGSGAPSHHHGVSSENKRVAIGVGVGVGVPLLAVISALIFYYRKKVKNV